MILTFLLLFVYYNIFIEYLALYMKVVKSHLPPEKEQEKSWQATSMC